MGRIKGILGMLVVGLGIYLGYLVAPAYYSNFEFQDYVEEQARYESYSTHNESEIAEVMAKKAHDLDIPVTAEQFQVHKAGQDLTISTEYTVHIDFFLHPFDLHFLVGTKNHKI